jgi:putative membrane protein
MQFNLPDYFFTDLASTAAFGLLAILLVVVGYKVFDKLTPKLDFDELLIKNNLAMAIVIGSFILGLCYVVARVVSAILGGS